MGARASCSALWLSSPVPILTFIYNMIVTGMVHGSAYLTSLTFSNSVYRSESYSVLFFNLTMSYSFWGSASSLMFIDVSMFVLISVCMPEFIIVIWYYLCPSVCVYIYLYVLFMWVLKSIPFLHLRMFYYEKK